MSSQFRLKINTPDGTFFINNVYILTIKINRGAIGILKNHTPLVSNIKACQFEIRREQSFKPDVGFISGGILQVDKEETRIICNNIIWKNDVNVKHFESELEKLEKKLIELKHKKEEPIQSLLSNREYYKLILNK